MLGETTFTRHEPILREIALKILQSGRDHSGIESRFGALMILADRLLVSCDATADHGDLPRRLGDSLDALVGRRPAAGTDLLRNCLEGWLKAVLHRVHPALYAAGKIRGGRFFNLYQTIADLELLSKDELDLTLEEASEILDPVRQQILVAKEHRNAPTHSATNVDPYGPDLRAGVVSLLAAIDRHHEVIAQRLRGLIVRPFPSEHVGLLHRIKSERDHRLSGFVGRREFLEDLFRVIDNLGREGGYVVVTAPEGFGKSAVASQVTEHENEGVERFGAAALQVARDAPWVPGVLFHAGKQSKDPLEFVPALVAQANALLLRPIAPVLLEDAPLVPEAAPRYDAQAVDKRGARAKVPAPSSSVAARDVADVEELPPAGSDARAASSSSAVIAPPEVPSAGRSSFAAARAVSDVAERPVVSSPV